MRSCEVRRLSRGPLRPLERPRAMHCGHAACISPTVEARVSGARRRQVWAGTAVRHTQAHGTCRILRSSCAHWEGELQHCARPCDRE